MEALSSVRMWSLKANKMVLTIKSKCRKSEVQCKTMQSNAKPSQTEQNKTMQNHAKPRKTTPKHCKTNAKTFIQKRRLQWMTDLGPQHRKLTAPGWLPQFRMKPSDRQANLLSRLPPTIWREEGNVGWGEGVVGGEDDSAVIPAF